jgi:hypothetical protein
MTYIPAGFKLGLMLSAAGAAVALALWFVRGTTSRVGEHATLNHAPRFRRWLLGTIVAIIVVSSIDLGPGPRLTLNSRWRDSVHRHTWGAGILAMKEHRK